MLWILAAALVVLKLPLCSFDGVVWGYLWGGIAVLSIIIGLAQGNLAVCLKPGGYLLLFFIVAAIGVLINNPLAVFRSWMRLGYLILTVLLLSPLLVSPVLNRLRQRVFAIFCLSMVAGTFVSCAIYAYSAYVNALPYTFCGIYNNPMTASFMAALSFAICMGAYLSDRRKITSFHWILVAGSVLSLLLICAGGSRMAFIAACLCAVFYGVLLRGPRVAMALGVIGASIVILYMIPGAFESVLRIFINKFNGAVAHESITWSRDSLWAARLEEFMTSPLVGIGIGNQTVFALPWDDPERIMSTGTIEPGSSWLAVLSQTGLIGFVLIAVYDLQVMIIFGKKFMSSYHEFSKRHSAAATMHQGVCMPVILTGIFIVSGIISLTEGYILAAGSVLCMAYWLVTGLMSASAESKNLFVRR